MKKKTKTRKKYTRKSPTIGQLKEELRLSEDARYDLARNFDSNIKDIQTRLHEKDQQLRYAHQLIDSQHAEINSLKETNLNLVEVMNSLGREERMRRQEKIFASYNNTSNQMEATAILENKS